MPLGHPRADSSRLDRAGRTARAARLGAAINGRTALGTVVAVHFEDVVDVRSGKYLGKVVWLKLLD